MRFLLTLFAAIYGFSFVTPAEAAFMIEPSVGYAMGSTSGEAIDGTQLEKTDTSGVAANLRLGFVGARSFIALEGGMVSGKAKGPADEVDLTTQNLGLVLGYYFPSFRMYAGYMFTSEYKEKAENSEYILKGDAVKVGLGLLFTNRFTLNVEYMMNNFKKVGDGTNEAEVSDSYKSLKYNPIAVNFAYMF